MAWFKQESSARSHFKFNRLAEALKIRRAEARGLFFGLCSWASENAPDGRLDGYKQDDIEDAADWQGRRGRMVPAFVECGLLDVVDGKHLEIHGFFERAGSYKEAKKKRDQRDRARTVPGQSLDSPLERTEKRGEDREERTNGTPPARIETIKEAQAFAVTNDQARELVDHWQAERERLQSASPVLMQPPTVVEHAKAVIVNAGGNMVIAKAVVTSFVKSTHKYWVDKKHALWLLTEPRDFEQARLDAVSVTPTKSRSERIAAEDAKRKAREAQEEADSLAEYERERAKEAGNGIAAQS